MTKDETKAKKALKKTKNVPEGDNEEGDKSETASIVERAESAAERLEKTFKAQQELYKEQQELFAKQKLGGKSSGPSEKKKPKELSAEEFKESFMKGEQKFPKSSKG